MSINFDKIFVPKPGVQYVSVLDLLTLTSAVRQAASNPEVGFEDADKTHKQLLLELGTERIIPLPHKKLESALWACNLLNERGEFSHPTGEKFEKWLDSMLDPNRFDLFRNTIISRG